MFAFRDRRGDVEVAFTDRHAADGGPLNLSLVRNGHPVTGPPVRTSLADVALAFGGGASPAGMTQVHGGDVFVVEESYDGREIIADGIVTARRGVALLVRAADCVPVLLADVSAGVVGAAHAGRPGLVARIVPHTVAAMRALGASQIEAWVGPYVCGSCYEVPEEMRAHVSEQVPGSYAETSWGTPALDIGAGVVAQLLADGVHATRVDRCTREDADLWSHRREGVAAGRLGGLVMVSP